MNSGYLRVLAVDDEPPALDELAYLLRADARVGRLHTAGDATEALRVLRDMDIDAVFLDIRMPGLDGMELARVLGRFAKPPAVVFVTAYDEYALGAFEVHALDYVLKPFSAERFKSAVVHARQHLSARRASGAQPAAERRDRLVIKSSGRIYFVRTREIDWCEAAGNYVRLHVGAQTHLVRGTMGHIESQLDAGQFVRIHRSTIVNADRIQELHSSFGGEYVVVLHDKTRLTLSRGYRDGLQAKLGKAL
jgi:DNA-binding LytR/AlgR family response regulator